MPNQVPAHRPHAIYDNRVARHRPRRPSAAARGYGPRWRRLARMFLRRHPLCADPFGVHGGGCVPAEQVDHVVPRRAGGTDDWSNLQGLCARCHARKTARCDGGFGHKTTRVVKGVGRSDPGGDSMWDRAAPARVSSRVLV